MGENGGALLRDIQTDKQKVRDLDQRDMDADLYTRTLKFINSAEAKDVGALETIRGALNNLVVGRGADRVPYYTALAELAEQKIGMLSGGSNPIMEKAAKATEEKRERNSFLNKLRKRG